MSATSSPRKFKYNSRLNIEYYVKKVELESWDDIWTGSEGKAKKDERLDSLEKQAFEYFKHEYIYKPIPYSYSHLFNLGSSHRFNQIYSVRAEC